MSTSGDFDVRLEKTPAGAAVLHVSGDLDLATAPRFEEAVASAGPAASIVIDLSGCTFLDSAGMRSLVNASRSIQPGSRIHLVTTDPRILRVLEITGIDSVLAVHTSVEDAL